VKPKTRSNGSARHEQAPTYQYQALGPFFLPVFYINGGISTPGAPPINEGEGRAEYPNIVIHRPQPFAFFIQDRLTQLGLKGSLTESGRAKG